MLSSPGWLSENGSNMREAGILNHRRWSAPPSLLLRLFSELQLPSANTKHGGWLHPAAGERRQQQQQQQRAGSSSFCGLDPFVSVLLLLIDVVFEQ
jgi:hypothetical protein